MLYGACVWLECVKHWGQKLGLVSDAVHIRSAHLPQTSIPPLHLWASVCVTMCLLDVCVCILHVCFLFLKTLNCLSLISGHFVEFENVDILQYEKRQTLMQTYFKVRMCGCLAVWHDLNATGKNHQSRTFSGPTFVALKSVSTSVWFAAVSTPHPLTLECVELHGQTAEPDTVTHTLTAWK